MIISVVLLLFFFEMFLRKAAVLSASLVAGISHLSHEFGLSRIGTVVGLLGLPGTAVVRKEKNLMI